MFKTYSQDKFGNPSAGQPVKVTAGSGVVHRRDVQPASKAPTKRTASSDTGLTGGGSYGVDRYNPAFDRLDEGSVVED